MSETRIRISTMLSPSERKSSSSDCCFTADSDDAHVQASQPIILHVSPSTSQIESQQESSFSSSDVDTGDATVQQRQAHTLTEFVYFAILFAAVPGTTLACFGLATTRLGNVIGAWQSGFLYASYTLTALTISSGIVQKFGSKYAIQIGMWFLNCYVISFWIASFMNDDAWVPLAAYMGASIGGVGAGIMWTAQGTYFASATQELTQPNNLPRARSSAYLASLFATVLLLEETLLDSLSTLLVRHWNVSWRMVFGVYAFIAATATVCMRYACNYDEANIGMNRSNHPSSLDESWYHKITAAISLLIRDSKLKYLCGLPMVFALSGGFVNSFVASQVVPIALGNATSFIINNSSTASFTNTSSTIPEVVSSSTSPDTWIGAFTALHGLVAVVTSLLLARFAACGNRQATNTATNSLSSISKPILHRMIRRVDLVLLMVGTLLLGGIGVLYVWNPDPLDWTWKHVVLVYTLQGMGRATFEATLKAVFADCYSVGESMIKEAAFANILLHNGMWSFASYALSIHMTCMPPPPPPATSPATSQRPSSSVSATYNDCWQYRDGSWHDIGILAWLLLIGSLAATIGYSRAWYLLRTDQYSPPEFDDRALQRRSSKQSLFPYLGTGWLSYQTVEMDDTDEFQGTELSEMTRHLRCFGSL